MVTTSTWIFKAMFQGDLVVTNETPPIGGGDSLPVVRANRDSLPVRYQSTPVSLPTPLRFVTQIVTGFRVVTNWVTKRTILVQWKTGKIAPNYSHLKAPFTALFPLAETGVSVPLKLLQ